MFDSAHAAARRRWRRLVPVAALVCCLWPAASAQALATPSGATIDAQTTGASTATFDGFVVTGGVATNWYFAYAESGSTFCTSYGASGTAQDTATQTVSSDGAVSADVSGLTPGAGYCYELLVSQGGSPVSGGVKTVTIGLPTAWTQSAESTGESTATVSGEVSPSGQATTYEVGYDTDGSQWCLSAGELGSPRQTSAPQSLDPSAGAEQAVSVDLSGLTPGTEYCAALLASNGSGTAAGATMEFLEGAPAAELTSATATADTAATIDGQVDPAGQATSYAVEYGTAESDWCTNEGMSGVPDLTTAHSLPAGEDGPADVEVDLSGLEPGTAYCAELLAINDSASVSSVMTTFTTTGTAGTGTTTTTSTTTTSTTTTTTPTTTTTTPTPTTTTTTTAPTSTTTTPTTTTAPSTTTTTSSSPTTTTSPSTTTTPASTTPTTGSATSGAGSTTSAPTSTTSPSPTSPTTGEGTATASATRSAAPTYAVAVGRSRRAQSVSVRVPKAGALRLRVTSRRAATVSITLTVPGGRHAHGATVRVARISVRAHATRTIIVRFSKALQRALRGVRRVKLTTTAR